MTFKIVAEQMLSVIVLGSCFGQFFRSLKSSWIILEFSNSYPCLVLLKVFKGL